MISFRWLVCTFILLLWQSGAAADTNELRPPPVTTEVDGNPSTLKVSKQPNRGQLLYENHCLSCHESVVHSRGARKAVSVGDIRVWVIRWSRHLKLDWDEKEINDVSDYVNLRFYQFTP